MSPAGPPPFELVNAEGRHRIIFVCDHASNALPPETGGLGLPAAERERHIAYDIGAAALTRALAARFAAPAVLGEYSRLLIDLNRGPDDPTLVMKLSDGAIVPGNRAVDAAEVERRRILYYEPYHAAIAAQIAAARAAGVVPALISIHSFTPAWKGRPRPWHVGVLWDRDPRIAKPLLARLAAEPGLVVGDNEPYSGELEGDCMWRHATAQGLPHVLIEVRQDLIADAAGVTRMTALVGRALEDVLADPAVATLRFHRPIPVTMEGRQMDESTRTALEAAAFRRLVAHLRTRPDVQNIDLMNLAGFCRNCLGDWYREAAEAQGLALTKDEARETVYGMPYAEWKAKHQTAASPEQSAAFRKTHSHG